MDSYLYETKLANHKIFKDIKESLQENSNGKLRNLIDLKNEVFYVWSSEKQCLFALNLKKLDENENETPYQHLHLLHPPHFPVERITGSICGSRMCVWGSRGVAIMELPPRWGPSGMFGSGKQFVLCKSVTLDERYLFLNARVQRVHWHPTSPAHLLVLVSDNTLRLHNIAMKAGPKLIQSFRVGPKPVSFVAGGILDSLGDTAVDFTPVPFSESFLILRGNGDIYTLEFDMEDKPPLHMKLAGPLAMFPSADDNYGTDSCAIAALGGPDTPPIIIVATCSLDIYHCILLPNPSDEENDALYVVEAVELNIGLKPDAADMQYSYPVDLYPCNGLNGAEYVCAHAGGAHAVSLPLAEQLHHYALASPDQCEDALSSICRSSSIARHLVCTNICGGELTPPVGIVITDPPLLSVLILCADGTLLTRTIEPFNVEEQLYQEIILKIPTLDDDDINEIIRKSQKVSFTSTMQEILHRETSQPILNINANGDANLKECLEMLSSAVVKLRTQYMCRQQRAADAISNKLKALRELSAEYRLMYEDYQKNLEEVRQRVLMLKVKSATAAKQQEIIKQRYSSIIRQLRINKPPSAVERQLLSEMEKYKRYGERFAKQIEELKQQTQNKVDEIKKWREEYNQTVGTTFGKSHSETISSILNHQTQQISTLIEETKLLKDQLSII